MFASILRALLKPPRQSYSKPSRRRLPPKLIPVERRKLSKVSNKRVSQAKPRPFDPATAKPQAQKQTVSGPAYIVDGDTITLRRIQVRLFGIDAPELNHPYGQIAKKALRQMCAGQTVNAEILEKDDHGRTVAICRLDDGRDLSAEMVKLGLAIDWPKFSGGVYQQFETPDARKKLWLADARQKGRMYLWYRFDLEKGRQTAPGGASQSEAKTEVLEQAAPECTCQICGAEMVRRTNRKTGATFWGCSKFPKCKGSRSAD
ncbi:MAG: thermonuclease family protein [Paracoccaceae bacterium]